MRWCVQEGYSPVTVWEALLINALRHRPGAAGESGSAVARALRLRPNTVTEMFSVTTDLADHNVRALTALATHLGSRLEAVSFDSPWG